MQFPILPPPHIAPVAPAPPTSLDVPALPVFADVLAALRGAPLAAKAAWGGPAAAIVQEDMGESPDPLADEAVAAGAVVMADGVVAPVIADRHSPVPDDGADPDQTAREAPAAEVARPVVALGLPDGPAKPADPVGGQVPAPVDKAGPVALPDRPVPPALSEAPRANPTQAASQAPALNPARHPPVPPVAEGWAIPPALPAPKNQQPPATAAPAFAPGPVAPPPPSLSRLADLPPVGGEAGSLRSDTGLVSGPAPALAEGARPGPAAPPGAPVTPQAVAAQIAVALGRSADGTIDIALHPQELGRLRLSLTPTDAGLVVTIAAERPETLDLLRRHAADLGQDLRSLGFRDVDLNFGAPGSDHFRGHPAARPVEEVAFAASDRPAQAPSPFPCRAGPSWGWWARHPTVGGSIDRSRHCTPTGAARNGAANRLERRDAVLGFRDVHPHADRAGPVSGPA